MAEPSLVNRLTEWAVTAQQSHPGAQQCTSTTGGRVRQKYSKGAAVTQFWPHFAEFKGKAQFLESSFSVFLAFAL